jgi:hypothetical protein
MNPLHKASGCKHNISQSQGIYFPDAGCVVQGQPTTQSLAKDYPQLQVTVLPKATPKLNH